MSSKMDVYAPCPCGSGKKVKFCCNNALLDMDRIASLHEHRQPEQALKALDKLAGKYPQAPIIPITRAQLLMEEQQYHDAAGVMREFLKDNRDNGHGTALFAFAQFMDVGFDEARPEIHRAFQLCPNSSPDVIASLAAQIADDVYWSSTMSAREHLGLALRLTQDARDRQALFQQLMRLDGSQEIPYPLRGPHHLEAIDGPEGTEKDLKSAVRLSHLGCWEIAAKLFHKVVELMPDNWALWKNIGLCRAWDTNHSGAAEALHKAADLSPSYESAVECETLAQLLELPKVEVQIAVKAVRFRVKSTSQALGILDGTELLHRTAVQRNPKQKSNLTARYLLLNHALPGNSEQVTGENAPLIEGEVAVFDFNTEADKYGIVSVMAAEGDEVERATELVRAALGDAVEPLMAHVHDHDHDHDENCQHDHDHDAQRDVSGDIKAASTVRTVQKELLPSRNRKFFGTRVNLKVQREIARQDGRQFVMNVWSNTPLNRLGGKTPREASQDAAMKIKLAAAVHVLESVSEPAMLYLDPNEIRESLGIAPECSLEVGDDLSLNVLSVMQSHRLPVSQLSDDQLSHIVNRALLIRHVPFAYSVLNEVSKRNIESIYGIDRPTFLRTIAQICRDRGDREQAVKWVVTGREEAEQGDNFEEKIVWSMREFEFRLEDKDDPGIPDLVDRLWNYYGAKLPQLREGLKATLTEIGLPIPGETAGGLLLPESVGAGAASGESKLWLPD